MIDADSFVHRDFHTTRQLLGLCGLCTGFCVFMDFSLIFDFLSSLLLFCSFTDWYCNVSPLDFSRLPCCYSRISLRCWLYAGCMDHIHTAMISTFCIWSFFSSGECTSWRRKVEDDSLALLMGFKSQIIGPYYRGWEGRGRGDNECLLLVLY